MPRAAKPSKKAKKASKPAVKKAVAKKASKKPAKKAVSKQTASSAGRSKKASSAKVSKPTVKSSPEPQATTASEKVKARQIALSRARNEAEEKKAEKTKLETQAPEVKKRGRKSKSNLEALEGLSKLGKRWAALYRKAGNTKVPTYSMRGVFEEKSPIQHKVLGWGYILSNKNDRLEVLFKDGIRFLISNYKA